jgi:integrase
MTLRELFHHHYLPVRHLSPKAIACYEVSLRHIDRWLASVEGRNPGPARLDDLTDLGMARFVTWRERATCRATAKRDRTQILCLWRYACRSGWLTIWPNPTPLRVPQRIARATKSGELEQLLDHFTGIGGQVDGVPAGAWWSSLLTTLYQCGTRITETLAVEWPAVDDGSQTILFRAETRKGQTRDIVRDISPELASTLSGRRRESGRVWRWDRCATHLWAHFKAHCRAAGVPYRGFHGLRRAALSYTKAAGGDAQRLGDHSDPRTTEVYLDPDIVRPESNLARLPLIRQLRRETPRDTAAPSREEAAARAGYAVGGTLGRAGIPRPSREASDELAVENGHEAAASWFRHGLSMGWAAEADRPPEAPAA